MLKISGTLIIPSAEIQVTFIRSRGPGGQNVNKVASAVQLRFDILNSSLPQLYKQRLMALSDKRISRDSVITIKAQQERSQKKNRDLAMRRLRMLIQRVMSTPKKRIATHPPVSARIKRLDEKRDRGKLKKLRQKVEFHD